MNLGFIPTICLTVFSLSLSAQKEHQEVMLLDPTDPAKWIYESPTTIPGQVGNEYLFEKWEVGTVVFRNKIKREDLYLNYNLERQELEILTDQGVKIAPHQIIDHWTIQSGERTFIPVEAHNLLEEKGSSFLEILYGDINGVSLMIEHSIYSRKPTYNSQLGLGDNNYRLFPQKRTYLNYKNKRVELPKSAKKREKEISSLLRSNQISKLCKSHKLHLQEEEDLVQLLELWAAN